MTVYEAFTRGRGEKRPRQTPSVVLTAAAWAGRRLPTWAKARTTVLTVGGLGCLDYAAYGWHHLVGYVAVGASLLVLEALGGRR